MISPETKPTIWARYILLAVPVATVLSPPLTNLLELVLYILFIATPELRKRFLSSFQQPLVIFGFIFTAVILISSLWSNVHWNIKSEAMFSWRKILLLPITVALINTPTIKDRFLVVFIIAISVLASLSWFSYISNISIYKTPNAMLRNHATQSLVFFLASFAAAFVITYNKNISSKLKFVLFICLLITLSNSFIISTGRSGYILGIALTACFGIYLGGKKTLFFTPLLLIITASILYLSPTAKSQISKAWNNAINANTAENYTSAGVRVIFWQNTLPIIQKSPLIGHGLKGLQAEYTKQVEGVEGWKGTVTQDPHNQYLLILSEQGILGLVAFFAFIAACFFHKIDNFYRFLGLSVLAGWMATSLFNGHFSSSVEGRIILLWCAAMLAQPLAKKINSNKEDDNKKASS